MIDYKYPTIASGVTPIGSAGRAHDEKLFREEQGRKFWVHCRWQVPENKLDIYSHRECRFKNPTILAIAFEVELKKLKISRSQRLKKSKFEKVKDWRNQRIKEVKDLKFGDSTQVYDSSRVSGATDVGMPFGYPWISIPGLAHYGGGQVQGV
jgi:hypothetical protein